jgi:hypothetical protein
MTPGPVFQGHLLRFSVAHRWADPTFFFTTETPGGCVSVASHKLGLARVSVAFANSTRARPSYRDPDCTAINSAQPTNHGIVAADASNFAFSTAIPANP